MKLIINADDFGLSKSITDGIVEGIGEGYLTSTSLMANMPFAKYAVEQAILNNIKCVGLHINLTVGKPVIANPNLTDENGVFLYNRKQIENPKLTYQDAYNEINAQIQKAKEYSNGKLQIDHFDMHHHLFDNIIIKKVVLDIAKDLNLPIRNEFKEKFKKPDYLESDFTIDNVNLETIKHIVNKYMNKQVAVELMTHPGYIDDYTKTVTSYLGRDKELQVLKEAKESGLFNGIELMNFSEL